MRLLLPLLTALSVAAAAVLHRDPSDQHGVETSNGLSDPTPLVPKATIPDGEIETPANDTVNSTLVTRAENYVNVVQIFSGTDFKPKWKHYTTEDTYNMACVNYYALVGKTTKSVRQYAQPGTHVSCDYYSEYDCGLDYAAKMTHDDDWHQADLSKEPRYRYSDHTEVGTWDGVLASVQCFFVTKIGPAAPERVPGVYKGD